VLIDFSGARAAPTLQCTSVNGHAFRQRMALLHEAKFPPPAISFETNTPAGIYSAWMGRIKVGRTIYKRAPSAAVVVGIRFAVFIALLCAGAHPALTELYKPPTQRAVRVKIINGVLLAEGSISVHTGKPEVSGLFVVDTAATATIVNPETARALGGKGAPGEQIADATLKLAGAQVSHRSVSVYSVDAFAKETGQPVIGIAGSDIFQNFGARIDYINKSLTLIVLQSCATPDEHVRIKVINGLPFVQATLQTSSGRKVQGVFLVDTGQAGPGLVFTSEFVKAHPELGGAAPPMRLAQLSLGSHAVKDVPATIAPPSPNGVGADLAGVIGGGILGHFDVTVDLPGSWLMLTPNDHSADPLAGDAR
jgi:hypothetical protein